MYWDWTKRNSSKYNFTAPKLDRGQFHDTSGLTAETAPDRAAVFFAPFGECSGRLFLCLKTKDPFMFHLIDGPVGPGEENDPDNLRILRAGLNTLGNRYRDPDEFPPLITREFEDATRAFQADHGLSQDGRWMPGGESERNLVARLTGDGFDRVSRSEVRLRGSIGNGGENRREDVVTGKRVFVALGQSGYDRTRPPSPFVDTALVDAIRDFQRRYGLPVTGLIDLDSDELKELGFEVEKLENKFREEFQVAVLPIVALGMAGLFLGMSAAGVHRAIKEGDSRAKRAYEDATRNINNRFPQGLGSGFTIMKHPGDGSLPNIPPDPNKFGGNRKPDQEPPRVIEKDPLIIPIPDNDIPLTTGFPIPDSAIDFVEVFPADEEAFSIKILERRGSERTEALNTRVARVIEKVAKKCGIEVKHVGGAYDEWGKRLGETHLKNKKTKGLKGGNFLDITIKIGKGEHAPRLHVNTTDTRADRITPSGRELKAAARILNNKKDRDYLVLVQKLKEDETLDEKELEELIKRILETMEGRPWKGRTIERPASDVYHILNEKKRAELSIRHSYA